MNPSALDLLDAEIEATASEMAGDMIYPVTCDCGFFGMSDDCHYNRCPNCGDRVRREKE